MTPDEREAEILQAKLNHSQSQILTYREMVRGYKEKIDKLELDKERYMEELCGKIDALVEILMALGYTESQARPLRNTILAKSVILEAIGKLQARVRKPKHTDQREPGDLQHQSLTGQHLMPFYDNVDHDHDPDLHGMDAR